MHERAIETKYQEKTWVLRVIFYIHVLDTCVISHIDEHILSWEQAPELRGYLGKVTTLPGTLSSPVTRLAHVS
jgi:hypothetical protein